MKYMVFVKSTENSGAPPRELMEAIGQLGAEASQAGVLVETGGLLPSALGARVRLSKGKVVVTDGPFTEAKELIGGYAVYDVQSKDDAIRWTSRFIELHKQHWTGWEGEAEIRQIFDASEFGPKAGGGQ